MPERSLLSFRHDSKGLHMFCKIVYFAIHFQFLTLVQTSFSLLISSTSRKQNNRLNLVLLHFYLEADGSFNLYGPLGINFIYIVINTVSTIAFNRKSNYI